MIIHLQSTADAFTTEQYFQTVVPKELNTMFVFEFGLFSFRLHLSTATPNSGFELGIQLQEFIYFLGKCRPSWSGDEIFFSIFVFK